MIFTSDFGNWHKHTFPGWDFGNWHKLGNNVDRCEEFSLSFVSVNTGDGSWEGNRIFFFIFDTDSVVGKGDTGKSISFDDDVLFLGDVLRNITDKFDSESSLSIVLLGTFDAAN